MDSKISLEKMVQLEIAYGIRGADADMDDWTEAAMIVARGESGFMFNQSFNNRNPYLAAAEWASDFINAGFRNVPPWIWHFMLRDINVAHENALKEKKRRAYDRFFKEKERE
jgi:hypothetical protein